MLKIGDEVTEKSTGEKAVIISMAEMAEMCYEIKYRNPQRPYRALRFARELIFKVSDDEFGEKLQERLF